MYKIKKYEKSKSRFRASKKVFYSFFHSICSFFNDVDQTNMFSDLHFVGAVASVVKYVPFLRWFCAYECVFLITNKTHQCNNG